MIVREKDLNILIGNQDFMTILLEMKNPWLTFKHI